MPAVWVIDVAREYGVWPVITHEGECILAADVDAGEIAEGEFDLDEVGHYARPDIFRLGRE